MAVSASRRIVFGHRITLGLCALLGTSCVDPNAFKLGTGEQGSDSTRGEADDQDPEPKPKKPQPKDKPDDDSTQDEEPTSSEREAEPEGDAEGTGGSEPSDTPKEPDETESKGTDTDEPDDDSGREGTGEDPDDDPNDDPEEDPDDPNDDPSDDPGEDSGDDPKDDDREPERERGHKPPGQACMEGKECTSGACTPIYLKWMRYEVKSRNCAECIDHQDCIQSGRGIACTPRIVATTKVDSAHYVCANGDRGEICEQPEHCQAGLLCGSLLPGNRNLPEIPIKSCGECITDADCKDRRFPKCEMNTIVPPRLPAYNVCVRG